MTAERRMHLSPGDIKSLVLECRACHGRITIPAGKHPHGDKMLACPACGSSWFADYTQATDIDNTLTLLEQLRAAEGGPVLVRFECDEPPRS